MVNDLDDFGDNEDWTSEDLTPYEIEERKRHREIERCPGANLEACLSWLDAMKFKLLREHEPPSKDFLKRTAETREAIFLADEIGADWGQIDTGHYVPKGFKRELDRRLEALAKPKQAEAIRLYKMYQAISIGLFQFLDPALKRFQCPEDFFRIVTPGEYDERESPSFETEEHMRQSIAEGLAKHVEGCESCMPEYARIVQKLAREKINSGRISINLRLVPESTFSKGIMYSTIKEVDAKLLGLY